jgi:hypothetical protein
MWTETGSMANRNPTTLPEGLVTTLLPFLDLLLKTFSEYGIQSENRYEKNPSSSDGINHMQCISGLGSQNSG